MDLYLLKLQFKPTDLEWRVQSAGTKDGKIWAMVLTYVTNRAIMDRLDSICGPGNWQNEYKPGPSGGIICGLSIKVGDEWVTKWDGAENSDIESVKGGLSNSMKRAAVQWGIGRYLYKLEASYVNVDPNGKNFQRGKNGKYESFKWNPPQLPEWAMPPNPDTRDYIENTLLTNSERDYLMTHKITAEMKTRLDQNIADRKSTTLVNGVV